MVLCGVEFAEPNPAPMLFRFHDVKTINDLLVRMCVHPCEHPRSSILCSSTCILIHLVLGTAHLIHTIAGAKLALVLVGC